MQDDLFAAFAAAEDGMARADAHADNAWKQAAEAAVLHVARMRVTFTADDVWRQLAVATAVETHEPSALGPILNRLRRQGVIKTTGEFVVSHRASRHAAPLRVWTKGN
jgi:hypothetical protein